MECQSLNYKRWQRKFGHFYNFIVGLILIGLPMQSTIVYILIFYYILITIFHKYDGGNFKSTWVKIS